MKGIPTFLTAYLNNGYVASKIKLHVFFVFPDLFTVKIMLVIGCSSRCRNAMIGTHLMKSTKILTVWTSNVGGVGKVATFCAATTVTMPFVEGVLREIWVAPNFQE